MIALSLVKILDSFPHVEKYPVYDHPTQNNLGISTDQLHFE